MRKAQILCNFFHFAPYLCLNTLSGLALKANIFYNVV